MQTSSSADASAEVNNPTETPLQEVLWVDFLWGQSNQHEIMKKEELFPKCPNAVTIEFEDGGKAVYMVADPVLLEVLDVLSSAHVRLPMECIPT